MSRAVPLSRAPVDGRSVLVVAGGERFSGDKAIDVVSGCREREQQRGSKSTGENNEKKNSIC